MASSTYMRGFAMLTGALVLWTASSVVVQMIFGSTGHFRKPLFVTLFNAAMSIPLLLPICTNTKQGVKKMASVLPASSTVGSLWLCSQIIFNLSLLHTSVATNTVLSSTTAIFTFIFSLVILQDPFRRRSFFAVMLSFSGCVVVSTQTPENTAEGAVTNSYLGDALALASAAMFACASVLLSKVAPEDMEVNVYMGVNGLFALTVAPCLLYAANAGGVEVYEAPEGRTVVALAANAFVGCVVANFLYTSALMLLPPLLANVYMCLSIPMSALVDEIVLSQHRFSSIWMIGATIVCMSVALAAFDTDDDPTMLELRKDANQDELESLVGNIGDHDELDD